ncbi:unnamed protein product [Schistosoma curassoni]|uniref:Reverse transcriptase domain-containing protein n=1 Tax=Schistosoma curassoni TaxID=6186 RepID=A0A183KPM2_9TREM|nr:unnamed protein product [Schistosoma curassoni]
MSKRDCRVSLEIYKNFLKRMESMNTFVRVAESAEPGGTPLSIDSENNPFKPVPPSVLEALEEHLTYLEGHKQVEKVSEKIVNIIRNSYDGLQCKMVHGGQLTDASQERIGARQGCLLSPFLFLLVVDWIMKTSTSEGKHGIQRTAQNQLDDLDFADDLALLSHTHEQMQIKTASVAAVSASVGLNIHKGKTKVLKYNTENSNPITLDDETLKDVESFTYLGTIIDEQGGSDADVEARIGKQGQHSYN